MRHIDPVVELSGSDPSRLEAEDDVDVDRSALPYLVMAPLGAALVGYVFVPAGTPIEVAYNAFGVVAMTLAFVGLRRHRVARSTGWLLVLCGFAMWVVGDILFSLQPGVLDIDAYPSPADIIYIAAYVVIAAGLLRMVRRRGGRGELAAVLDAAILATGVAVVAGVFILAPIAADSSLTTLGRLTSSAYPIGDLLLIGVLARLWTTPGARTAAFRLLGAALVSTLLADTIYNYTSIAGGSLGSSVWNDLLWLGAYAFIAGAAWAPSAAELAEPPPGREELSDPSKRLVVLTGGLLLPGLTLAVDGVTGDHVEWTVIAAGSVLLSGLVLSRMAGLLTVVQAQAVQLAALARSDPLTGAPNRRTWDHELSRACRAARESRTPLVVALIDLDHFKDYNDAFGHLAGDRLLREAVAAWTEVLRDGELLARYGGEEFALLFPGRRPAEARERLEQMLERTPHGQTFSAGVATWDPASLPSAALADADQAMYAAKRDGRNRICLAPQRSASNVTASMRVVFQPIIDLETRRPVAVEALSRFAGEDPATVFRHAHESGFGPELEASAISAALEVRPPDVLLAVNVGIDSLSSEPVRAALVGDLTGVILEITEYTDTDELGDLEGVIDDYRARGAIIAIDDWPRGFSGMDRLLWLRPEIVKIDMSLVHALESDYHRAAIQSLGSLAAMVGARLCAEGIETRAQWDELRTLGIHLGQGFFIAPPVDRAVLPSVLASVCGAIPS